MPLQAIRTKILKNEATQENYRKVMSHYHKNNIKPVTFETFQQQCTEVGTATAKVVLYNLLYR